MGIKKHIIMCNVYNKPFKVVKYNEIEPISDGYAKYKGKGYATREDLKYFPHKVHLLYVDKFV